MTGQQRDESNLQDRNSAGARKALEDCTEPDSQRTMLRLLQAIRHAGHELNNILTAAHCLVDLLAASPQAGPARKYLEDLHSLLGEFAAMGDSLRREGNSALVDNEGLRIELHRQSLARGRSEISR